VLVSVSKSAEGRSLIERETKRRNITINQPKIPTNQPTQQSIERFTSNELQHSIINLLLHINNHLNPPQPPHHPTQTPMPALIHPESTPMSTSDTSWQNSLGISPDHPQHYYPHHEDQYHQIQTFPQSSLGKRQREVGDDGRLGVSGGGGGGGMTMMTGQENDIGMFSTTGYGGFQQRVASREQDLGHGYGHEGTPESTSRLGMKRLKSNTVSI
jgi:hypothetical protein